ncbi:19461_t:CDS:2 [Rhizophagus irregularis]|nr:19461_t:CDS:2 [Rhizophagus irregularis]
MNPTIITSKPIVIVASELTEKPAGSNSSIHIIEHEFVGFPGFSVNSEVTMITGLEN